MEFKKQHQISIKIERKEPLQVDSKAFTKVLKSQVKKYEKIEEVAGKPIDEILLENLQLKNRRSDMGMQIKQLNDVINKTNNILHQLLELELVLNPDIAKPIANEFEVNKKLEHARKNLDSVDIVAEALRKIRYYYHPSVQEWVDVVQKAEKNEEYYRVRNEQIEQENNRLKNKLQEFETKDKEKMKVSSKGISIVVNGKKKEPVTAKAEMHEEPVSEENFIMKEEEIDITMEHGMDREVDMLPDFQMEEEKEEVLIEKMEEPEEVKQAKTVSRKEIDITYYDPTEVDMMDKLKKPKYMMLLDKKGYEYEMSEQPQYDVMIKNKTGKIPLLYIDYLIEQSEVFDDIMKKTDQIYILFDTKENMKKGNAKFAAWLLKSKEKRKMVKFSFTTVDELKVSGLDELNGL